MSLSQAHSALRAALGSNDLAQLATLLPQAKFLLAQQNLLFSPSPSSSASSADRLLAREVLEMNAEWAVRSGDVPALERAMALLEGVSTSWTDLAPSSALPSLLSSHLLALLATSRPAAFHTLLERSPPALLESPEVARAVALERGLMEGGYTRVWRMVQKLREEDPKGMDKLAGLLENSIREEIAHSFVASYASLPLGSAQRLLFLPREADTVSFANRHGWTLNPTRETVFFPASSSAASSASAAASVGVMRAGGKPEADDVGGMRGLIEESLGYARELEAIV